MNSKPLQIAKTAFMTKYNGLIYSFIKPYDYSNKNTYIVGLANETPSIPPAYSNLGAETTVSLPRSQNIINNSHLQDGGRKMLIRVPILLQINLHKLFSPIIWSLK